MKLKFQTREIGNVFVLSIEGGLIWERESDFLDKLMEIYDQGKYRVVVDLAKCYYINCSNLGLLIHFKKSFQEKGGDLKIVRISSLVKTIIEMADLHHFIEIYDSVETAAASYKE